MVSEEIVRMMAESVRNVTDTHYGIATTGIAGPSCGTPELPAGSVWIAVSSPIHTVSRLVYINGSRDKVIRKAGTSGRKKRRPLLLFAEKVVYFCIYSIF